MAAMGGVENSNSSKKEAVRKKKGGREVIKKLKKEKKSCLTEAERAARPDQFACDLLKLRPEHTLALAPIMDTGPKAMKKIEKYSVLSGIPLTVLKGEGRLESADSSSIRDGREAFSWLIAPIKPERFFTYAWEQAPLHVKRAGFTNYYQQILTTEKIDEILRNNLVLFSKNIDITTYWKDERRTHNPSGRATAAAVWDFFKKGCSIRMLNPQTFCPALWKLNATLQEFFGCFVGANSYLTPANSQGFAPHYDDIEAFILQLEGKKHWRLYSPRTPEEILPRFSSDNLSQLDIGDPILEVTLEAGDLLYFPRGFIHQAHTEPGHHSLHITLSCYQRNTWGDFLEKLLPAALSQAMEENVEFRKGLPLGYLSHIGVSRSEKITTQRDEFIKRVENLAQEVLKFLPIDATADQMGKQFMHDALPPVLTPGEEPHTIFSPGKIRITPDGSLTRENLDLDTPVKLLRAHILRLVKEDAESDSVHVYHYVDNSLEYHGLEPQSFEVPADFALGVEYLINKYPKFVVIRYIPVLKLDEKLELATLLWKKGLLIKDKPQCQDDAI